MSPYHRDKVFFGFIKLAATVSLLCLTFVIVFLLYESAAIFSSADLSQYFTDSGWHPTEGKYYLLPMIVGSVFILFGAMLISIPLGVFSAIFMHFYAPVYLSRLLLRIVEVLGGIPSVVFGFWGIMLIVPFLANIQAPGTSLLAGILVLTLIVFPGMTLFAHTALKQIDNLHIQNAIALGLCRYSIIRHIVLPQAKSGLFTGMILQAGRAIGETLAVLMVCGNVVQIPGSLFEPVRTLTSNIALEMAYAMDTHRSALFLSGLLLMLLVLGLVMLSEKFSPLRAQH